MDFDKLPVDPTPVPAAAPSSAPQSFDSLVSDEDKYGTPGQMALTALESGASGLTLGASGLAENALFHNQKERALRQETNPGTNIIGNIAGSAGLVGLTGGLAAPAEAAALSAGVAPIAAKALAYGAEGAVFGAGNSLSDYALGDPNLNAQKILANVSMGALFGAGIGAAHGLISSKLGDIASKANASAETSAALAGTESSTEGAASGASRVDTPSGFFKTIGVDKAEAPQIRDAMTDLGIDIDQNGILAKGMTSANRTVQRATDTLVNGAPSIVGEMVQADAQKVWDGINGTLDNVLDTGDRYGGGAMTKAELGKAFEQSLTNKISTEVAPINDIYSVLKSHNINIPVEEGAASKIATAISKLQEVRVDPRAPAAQLANRISDALENLENVDDLKFLNKSIGQSLGPTASSSEKHMAGVLSDMLNDLEEKSITNAAKDPSVPLSMRDDMLGLLDKAAEAKRLYAPFKQKITTLLEQLGKKNVAGAQSAIAHIQGLDVEDVVSRLAKGKSEFGSFLQENFPEEAALLAQYEKQTLREAASKTGEFSPKTFFTLLKKIEPEKQKLLFGADELEKMSKAELLLNKGLPKNFNGSGTDNTRVLRSFFEQGVQGAVGANVRDFGIGAFIKAAGSSPGVNPYELGAEMADKFNTMSAVRQMAEKQDNEIASAAKSIFSSKDSIRGAALAGAALASDHGYDKVVKNIKNLADNPAGIIDHLVHHTGDLQKSLPNVVQAMHNTSIQALSFLNSKLPRATGNFVMSAPYKPSEAEKSKFMRYYNAVNDPTSVLNDVKHGSLTNEAMEALHVVHPQLLQQMQKEVVSNMKGKNLPYSVKMAVAKFLGTPVDSSMTPQVILSNQASLSGPQLGQQQAAPTGRRGSMKGLNMSQRAKTQSQDDELDTK